MLPLAQPRDKINRKFCREFWSVIKKKNVYYDNILKVGRSAHGESAGAFARRGQIKKDMLQCV